MYRKSITNAPWMYHKCITNASHTYHKWIANVLQMHHELHYKCIRWPIWVADNNAHNRTTSIAYTATGLHVVMCHKYITNVKVISTKLGMIFLNSKIILKINVLFMVKIIHVLKNVKIKKINWWHITNHWNTTYISV